MPIANVALSNTFNEFRSTTNLVIGEVNKLSDGTAVLVVDAITANTYTGVSSTLTISGNTGTDAVSLVTETLRTVGTNGISTSVASNTITVTLNNSGVTAGTYGSGSKVPQIVIDAQGRITSAANVNVAGVSGFNYHTGNANFQIVTADGGSFTASIGQHLGTSASVSFQDLTVTGNVTFTGNVVSVTANNLVVEDNIIQIGKFNNTDAVDLGFLGHYYSGANLHAGLFRDATDGVWKFFDNYTVEPGTNTNINISGSGFRFANLTAHNITSNGIFSGNGSQLTTLNASNLTSGTVNTARLGSGTANSLTYLRGDQTYAVIPTASANGAGTIVSRDSGGSFVGNIITATTFSGSGASLTSIPNSATTAASANGASTIVSRDSGGSFVGNIITATTFSGSGASLTSIPNSATTASSSNGASTIVARDTGGSFDANRVTATTFIGSGAEVTTLNASNLTSGTVATARLGSGTANNLTYLRGDQTWATIPSTTGTSANGASTIVARDTGGSFDANRVTATTFIGSGAEVTTLNASNLTSGTVATARLGSGTANSLTYLRGDQTYAVIPTASANGAGTIVSRDSGGSFAGNIITATTFSGSGASLTSIPNSATTASSSNGASTIVSRDSGGSFAGNIITATTFSGSGAEVTSLNASNLTSGTVATARLGSGTANSLTYLTGNSSYAVIPTASANGAGTIVSRDSGGSASFNIVTATTFSGSGASLTSIPNSATTAASANGASTIVARDSGGSFVGNRITATTFIGSGAEVTTLNASNLTSGTVATARLGSGTANSLTYLRGDQTYAVIPTASANGAGTIVSRDSGGSAAFNIVTATTFSGSGASLTSIPNSATTASSSNSASTIVARDTGGSFAANRITSTTFIGSGAEVTSLNASNLTSGTVATARLGSGTANSLTYLRGDQTYAVIPTASANGAGTIVSRDSGGSAAFNIVTANTFSGSGASLSSIPNSATTASSSNGASTIVSRDSGGSFAANRVTGTTFVGSGAEVTSLNASNLTSGTVATARLGSGTANSLTYLTGNSSYAVIPTASANGSGTIVSRDSGGSAAFNIVTANVNLSGVSDSNTAASHYLIETGSDGYIRPKTLANVQIEIVTTAALATGTANNVTYLRGDRTWATLGASGATITDDTSTNSNARYLVFTTANTGTMTIANTSSTKLYFNPSTGTLNATVFNSLSDETLKKNITKITNATDLISLLDGVEFEWAENGTKSSGLIAQWIEKIVPHLVSSGDNEIKTVNYSGLIAYLVEAVKELNERVKKLESK